MQQEYQTQIKTCQNKGKSFKSSKRSRPVFRITPVEGIRETVIDFTKMSKKGVKAITLLKYL